MILDQPIFPGSTTVYPTTLPADIGINAIFCTSQDKELYFSSPLVHDLNFPSEHRLVQRGNGTQTADVKPGQVAILVGISAAALLLCFFLLLLLLRHKQRKKAARQNSREDQCPVYGMYYFADGVHIDGGDSEVVDRNVNYAAA